MRPRLGTRQGQAFTQVKNANMQNQHHVQKEKRKEKIENGKKGVVVRGDTDIASVFSQPSGNALETRRLSSSPQNLQATFHGGFPFGYRLPVFLRVYIHLTTERIAQQVATEREKERKAAFHCLVPSALWINLI